MDKMIKRLFEFKDENYRDFTIKLTPGLTKDEVIGVRSNNLKLVAKEFKDDKDIDSFLRDLPHKYHEENMVHAFILKYKKDYRESIEYLDLFLPYVTNWMVCDTLDSGSFSKNMDKVVNDIKRWLASKKLYTVRFAVDTLMDYYLDDYFKEEYLVWVSKIKSTEYYLNMVVAWYFATALAKQYDATIPYIEDKILDPWTHNKTIQKAIESYRISDEQKTYLRTLKISK